MALEIIENEVVFNEIIEDTPMPNSQWSGILTVEQDEGIAQFFKDHLVFFHKTLSDYKNKQKNATIKNIVDEIGNYR